MCSQGVTWDVWIAMGVHFGCYMGCVDGHVYLHVCVLICCRSAEFFVIMSH